MKWLLKLTKITAYVSQCANAISKAAESLNANWPSDNPFTKPADNGSDKKEGVALGSETK